MNEMNNLFDPKVLVNVMNSQINEILQSKKTVKQELYKESEPTFSENEVREIISEAFGEDLQKKMIEVLFSSNVFNQIVNKVLNAVINTLDVKVKSIDLTIEKKASQTS